MKKYRKKPVIVEAVQWKGDNFDECMRFMNRFYYEEQHISSGKIIIHTLEGNMIASKGDYIIKGVNGEFYPCKPDIFKKTYEEIVE